MIEVIQQQFRPGMSVDDKVNMTREFLQILCLKIMSEQRMFDHCAFVGGTSLRILFGLRRFSEDLDFSLVENKGYDFQQINEQLFRSFRLYGLPMETRVKIKGNVHNLMMRFTGLLKDLGLSGLAEQKLSINLEIDANPPAGWRVTNTIVNKVYVFNIVHYDLPSLYAGKLHACFYRKFTKGRDLYDLMWYLGKKIKPNFTMLNNAIQQTQKKEAGIDEKNFKQFLLDYVRRVDFDHVKRDVERFLEDKNELNIFDPKVIIDTIESVY